MAAVPSGFFIRKGTGVARDGGQEATSSALCAHSGEKLAGDSALRDAKRGAKACLAFFAGVRTC